MTTEIPGYWQLLLMVLPVFAMVGIGAGLRRVGWLTAEADESLLKLVVNFLYPCLIFQNVLGNPALRDPANLALAPLVGFVTIAAGIVLTLYLGRLLGLGIGRGLRTFAFAVGIYNYGYIPMALMESLFGRESIGVLLLHNVGCEAAIWTVGILVLSGLSVREGWRKLLNPPVVALILAVGLNLVGWHEHLPKVVVTLIDMSAVCAIPLGLLLIGATLAEYLAKPASVYEPRVSSGSGLLRLAVLPPLFLLLAQVLPAPVELKRVIIVQAAMPAGIMPIVIAKHYGGQPLVAVRVVIGTTVVGLLAIPLWLRLGLAWVE